MELCSAGTVGPGGSEGSQGRLGNQATWQKIQVSQLTWAVSLIIDPRIRYFFWSDGGKGRPFAAVYRGLNEMEHFDASGQVSSETIEEFLKEQYLSATQRCADLCLFRF